MSSSTSTCRRTGGMSPTSTEDPKAGLCSRNDFERRERLGIQAYELQTSAGRDAAALPAELLSRGWVPVLTGPDDPIEWRPPPS